MQDVLSNLNIKSESFQSKKFALPLLRVLWETKFVSYERLEMEIKNTEKQFHWVTFCFTGLPKMSH